MEKKSKKIEILIFVILVVLILGLATTLYLRRNRITNVNKALANKFDEIKCLDDDCDFLTVYNKSKNKIYVYDSYGTKISKFDKSNSKMLYDATPNYLLFKNVSDKGKIKSYYITKVNGKKVYSSKNELTVLTDFLVEEKLDDSSNIVNNKGDVLYSNISKVKRYRNVSSIKVLDDEYLIDEKGDRTLDDYVVDNEVLDSEGETLYLILKDSSNAYYYFDAKNEKFRGDNFTSYNINETKKTIKAYRKSNGETIVLDIDKKGEQKESEEESQVKIVKKIKPNLDEKYRLYQKALYSNLQDKVLVDNLEDNSFGTFDLKEKKYKKLYDYAQENGSSIVLSFKSYNDDKYYQISCSESMCGTAKVTVYDAKKGKVLFEYTDGEDKIKNFTGLEGGYKLVKYTGNSTEEFSNKYVLYNKKNEIVAKSDNLITVVDKGIIFGKKYDEESSIIYSAKLKKVLNTDDTLADVKKVGKSKVYRYEDDKKTYIVTENGKVLFKVNKEKANLVFSKDLIMNVSDKKVSLISAKNDKVGEYKFEKNESLVSSEGEDIQSYKNSIFVNNSTDNYGKIVDYTGTKIKKIKKATIAKVSQSKETKNIVIITTNGKKYGLYIAK